MEQTTDSQTPTAKVYKDRAIWVGTFLGGPLAAGYIIAENFKVFNEADKARKTWMYTILATVVIFGGIMLIPDHIKLPNQVIPFMYTAIAYYLVQHYQGQNISAHISSGGEFQSWGRTIVVGLIGLAITIVPIIGFVLVSDSVANASLSTKTYGMMKNEILFEKDNITEGEVDKLADAFTKATFFDEAVTKYVYVTKINSTYELSIPITQGIEKNGEALQRFIDLRTDVQSIFPNHKIVFKLVIDNLDNVVKRLE